MKQIKKWIVCYSLKYINNHVVEKQVQVDARSLMEAFRVATQNNVAADLKEKDVQEAVVWDVGLEESEDPF